MQFNIPAEYKNASGVYIIRNSVNSKVYVGSARNFWNRYQGHRSNLRRNKHHNKHIQNFYNKYGEDAFNFNLLELVPDEVNELVKAENAHIKAFDSASPSKGFNNMPASFPARHSENTKTKLRALLASYMTPEVLEKRLAGQRAAAAKKTEARLARIATCGTCGNEFTPKAWKRLDKARFCSQQCVNNRPISEVTREKYRARVAQLNTPEARVKSAQARKGRGDVRSLEGKERQRHAVTGLNHTEERKAKERAHLTRPDVVAKRLAVLKENGPWNKSTEAERQRTCSCCGATFLVSWPKQKRLFCSRLCFEAKMRQAGPTNKLPDSERERDCPQCGTRFVVRPSERTRTCSKNCGYALRKTETQKKRAQQAIIF
jgi:group I intron endonuclease